MKYDVYQDRLKDALTVYRINNATMDALQGRFMFSFLALMVLMGASQFITLESLGIEVYGLLQIVLGTTMLASLIPYIASIIRHTLHQKEDINPFAAIVSDVGFSLMKVVLASVGFGILALWPYMLGQFFIAAKSNIFEAYTMSWAIIGIALIVYFAARVIGAVVLSVAGKPDGLSHTFRLTQGHGSSIILIMLVTNVPVWMVQTLINSFLSGLLKPNLLLITIPAHLLMMVVSISALLLQTYLMWAALTRYMKSEGMLD